MVEKKAKKSVKNAKKTYTPEEIVTTIYVDALKRKCSGMYRLALDRVLTALNDGHPNNILKEQSAWKNKTNGRYELKNAIKK